MAYSTRSASTAEASIFNGNTLQPFLQIPPQQPSKEASLVIQYLPPKVSDPISLKEYGILQSTEVDVRTMEHFTNICQKTPCFLDTYQVELPPDVRQVINQCCHIDEPLYMTKTPDGYMITIKNGDKQHLVSVIDPICKGSPTAKLHVIVKPPGVAAISHFCMANHDHIAEAHHITRTSTMNHILDQILTARDFTAEPSKVYSADSLGDLMCRICEGPPAFELQMKIKGFIQSATTGLGAQLYNVKLQLPKAISEELMLNANHVHIDRLDNGIIGFRLRPDGKRTFIFCAGSNDFFRSESSHPTKCMMQIWKANYADSSAQGPRITVVDDMDQCGEYGCVPIKGTLQDVLNYLEKTYRVYNQRDNNTHLFTAYLHITKNVISELQQQQGDSVDALARRLASAGRCAF